MITMDVNGVAFDTNGTSGDFDVPTDDADRLESRPVDPHGFPLRWLNSGIYVKDVPVFRCPVKRAPATQIRKMTAMPMREDDIFLTGYVKSGKWEFLSKINFVSPKICYRGRASNNCHTNISVAHAEQLVNYLCK